MMSLPGTRKYSCSLLLCLLSFSLFAQPESRFKYGIKGTLNYTTTGARYSKFTGSGQYSLGGFGIYQLSPRVSIALEPMITVNSFREMQSDNRYRYTYFDPNVNGYFNVFRGDALRIFLGVRPGYLLGNRSEVFKNGSYERAENPDNKNREGQLDIGINAGLSLRVSPVIDFEVGYLFSTNDQTNLSQVKGRPSALEVSLKINAVDLRDMIERKEETMIRKVSMYQKGALLVMLPTLSEKELARFKTDDDRQTVLDELRTRNIKVIQEFSRHYNFTPVYFFMDTSVNKVISGNLQGIFVNTALERDTTISPASPSNYFVASFCHDLANYNQKIAYGLFVYDNQMIQLGKPFNVASQLFGNFSDGDPVNYFRRKQSFVNMPFDRLIKKFNARMLRYAQAGE